MSATEQLFDLPWLKRVGRGDLDQAARHFTEQRLPPGGVLWEQGQLSTQIGILTRGELSVMVDGGRVGGIHRGELVGEAAAFFRGINRSATVKARNHSRVLLLPVEQMSRLRALRSPVYEALLDQALGTLVRRVQATDRRVSAVGAGARERPGGPPSAWMKLWRALVPGQPKGPCPPLTPLLERQIGLSQLDPASLEAIARAWRPQAFEEGRVVFLEGQPGDAAYLVAEGSVEVLRNVKGDKASCLAELGPGDLFGANALVDRAPRTASCVASRPTWLYRINARDFQSERGEAAVLWKESLLASFASQIRAANIALNKAMKVPPPPGGRRSESPEAFAGLLAAQGALEGLPLSEHSVDLAV
jgi:CRP-like cAMP-binding protein